jgi:spore maturation protein SpmB
MDVKATAQVGARQGLATTWQITKLIVPVYFAVAILQHTPLLPLLAAVFQPTLGLVGLPGEVALSLMMGVFVNIYAGIAVLMPLIPASHLGVKQITIVATMLLICHSLPLESAVSQKTGVPFWQVTLLRVVVAFIAGYIVNQVM